MAASEQRQPRGTDKKMRLNRRQLLTQSAALGAASALMAGCPGAKAPASPTSEENLIRASALSGEPLTPERVRGMKLMFDFTMKHLQTLREFDPDEAEPVTIFRP